MHNGKYETESYKLGQAAKVDRLWGPIKDHNKVCERCSKGYVWSGRQATKAYTASKFCSRSCANNRQTWWNDNATHYRTIAFRSWKEECAICGFDKVVAVHHIDSDHENNDPMNLIPLCPNHHEMAHSKWKDEVVPLIEQLVIEKVGGLVYLANTPGLQPGANGSNPLSSTRSN